MGLKVEQLRCGSKPTQPANSHFLSLISPETIPILIEQYGGCRLFIPKTLKRDHVLYQTLNETMRKNVSKIFGGCYVYIPKNHISKKTVLEKRNDEIRSLKLSGKTNIAIARIYHLSVRTIQIIASNQR
ncbi:MAG: hypothetical protein HQL75_00470 [Magnetococcales bacterium]|nr:hypothetical protein [Magnetococcales bacterium]